MCIRDSNSNGWQLYAQAKTIPADCKYFGIAEDTPEELIEKISTALSVSDLVILTGGVSMGDFDYVPAAMESAGGSILFKSIAIQPGRPTVFARYGDKFIFGLPGNPVSSFVLFELLVKPFVLKMMGCDPASHLHLLPMATGYSRKKSSRKSVVPVLVEKGQVHLLEYHSSAHINAYTRANAMLIVETGQTQIKKGELASVRLL